MDEPQGADPKGRLADLSFTQRIALLALLAFVISAGLAFSWRGLTAGCLTAALLVGVHSLTHRPDTLPTRVAVLEADVDDLAVTVDATRTRLRKDRKQVAADLDTLVERVNEVGDRLTAVENRLAGR